MPPAATLVAKYASTVGGPAFIAAKSIVTKGGMSMPAAGINATLANSIGFWVSESITFPVIFEWPWLKELMPTRRPKKVKISFIKFGLG